MTQDKELERLRLAIWAIIDTLDGAVAAHEYRTRGGGGQHVPYHGDFSAVGPSTVEHMRRWSRDLRHALRGEWPITRDEWEILFPNTDPKELDYFYRDREP